MGLLGVDTVLFDQPFLDLFREFGHGRPDLRHFLFCDQCRRDIGLGIHPGRSRQRPRVLRGAVRQGVPGLLRDTLQRFVGTFDCGDQRLPCGRLGRRAYHERVFGRRHSEEFFQRIHVLDVYPVVGKLVGMEYPFDPVGPGPLGHLGSQPEPPRVAVHRAGEARKFHCEHDAPALDGGRDDLGRAVSENIRRVDGFGDDGFHAPLSEDPLDLEEHLLPVHLVAHEVRQHLQLLDPLYLNAGPARDGYVQVFPYGPDAALHLFGRPEQRAETHRNLHHLFRSPHIRSRRHFYEREAEAVEPVGHFVAFGLYLPGRVLFQANGEYRDPPAVYFDFPARRHQCRPLETGGVRTVHNDLPHELDLVRYVCVEHRGEYEGGVHGLFVDIVGRLLVQVDQA